MSTRRKKYRPKPFESRGTTFTDDNGKVRADTSANIFKSMLYSEAFRSLKTAQKILYVYCKSEYYGSRKPGKDHKELEADNDLFYFNWDLALKNKLYAPSNSSKFYKDMQVLIDYGFIERVLSGKGHKQKTVYRFSDKWQFWKP